MGVLANHIATTGQCPVCQTHREDVAHALFKCAQAQEVLRALGLHEIITRACAPQRSGLCDLTNQKQYMDVVQIPEMIAATSWYLWWQRRQISKNEEVQQPVRTGPAIQALTLNYVRATGKTPMGPRINRWRKPLFGQLVLNVDASFSEEDYSGSCGDVVRDHLGAFVGASTAKLKHAADIVSAEAAALVEGLKLALRLGINSLLVQMDNLVVVEALNMNTGQAMVAAPIIEECRSMKEDFGKVLFEHCNRESNMVANVLAQQGRVDPPALWLDTPPVLEPRFRSPDAATHPLLPIDFFVLVSRSDSIDLLFSGRFPLLKAARHRSVCSRPDWPPRSAPRTGPPVQL